MERKRTLLLVGLVLLLVTLPYLVAAMQSDSSAVFGGFLVNPLDGHSYLAKMMEGADGAWQFTLPYTAQPGGGVYLFTFYLFLGHLARWIGLPPIWVFHLARVLSAVLLVVVARRFFAELIFPGRPRQAWIAALLATIGSGMGWIAAFAGAFTADFWVAEAYPFLSAYTNPHFPLGIALLLEIFLVLNRASTELRAAALFTLGLALAVILPFGLVIAGVVCLLIFAWHSLETRSFAPWKYAPLFAGGFPVALYQFWVTQNQPVLAAWNAQNLTLTPPAWDIGLSFSPALLLAIVGLPAAWRDRRAPGMRLMLTWFVAGLVLAYLPISLQRRFLMSFYLPVAGMAVIGLFELLRKPRLGWLLPLLFVISVPTNAMVIASGIFGSLERQPELFRSADSMAAMEWIEANTNPDALVLGGPDTGLYIPALTGRRVLYGHPYETANAAAEKALVTGFFSGDAHSAAVVAERGVDLIYVGSQENALGEWRVPPGFKVVFQQGQVTLYAREAQP